MYRQECNAEIIADSINTNGDRITTFLVEFPRIVLSEFNTHRKFSRNSASSRAIPFKTMLKKVQEDPFVPFKFQKDHKGMQGTEYFEGEEHAAKVKLWLEAREKAIESAIKLSESDVTKQLCNRLLEPFLWHRVIVTSTEWENFFSQRAHEAAEIHIQNLAYNMLLEYNCSKPVLKQGGEWHIPFGENISEERIREQFGRGLSADQVDQIKIKIATARCARVSYFNFEGKDDYASDLELFERLVEMGHWSPFEHCACSRSTLFLEFLKNFIAFITMDKRTKISQSNFKGWNQLRKNFLTENKKDDRVIVR